MIMSLHRNLILKNTVMDSSSQFYTTRDSLLPRLLNFYKELHEILKKFDVNPIIYGSLAYRYHTKDTSIPIHDIDLLVPQIKFSQITKGLDEQKISYELMPHHSIETFKDDLKIDIDSIEFFLDPRSRETSKFVLEDIELSIINKNSLTGIYQEALDNMPADKKLDNKRNGYQKKLDKLRLQ
jgi:hypothetical protein